MKQILLVTLVSIVMSGLVFGHTAQFAKEQYSKLILSNSKSPFYPRASTKFNRQCCMPTVGSYKVSSTQMYVQGSELSSFQGEATYYFNLEKKQFRIDTVTPNLPKVAPSNTMILFESNNTIYSFINTTAGCWCFAQSNQPWSPTCTQFPFIGSASVGPIAADIYGMENYPMKNAFQKAELWTYSDKQLSGGECWFLSEQVYVNIGPQNQTDVFSAMINSQTTSVPSDALFKPAHNCPALDKCVKQ